MSYQGTGAAPGDVLTWDGTSVVWAPGGAGSSTWTQIDTNFQYSTDTSQAVLVGTSDPEGEQNGSIAAVSVAAGAVRGIISWQHSTDANGASFEAIKSRGTRAAPTTVANGDVVGGVEFRGYDGSAYHGRAVVLAQVDGTVVDAGDVVPMAVSIFTGSTAEVRRTTWSSSGAQNHDMDAGGIYTYAINSDLVYQSNATAHTWYLASVGAATLVGGVLYVGTTDPEAEITGSIAAVSTSTSVPRGIISWQHSANTAGASFTATKSRGTRATPAAVANGDLIGGVEFRGYDGSAYQARAAIVAQVDGTVVDAGDIVPMSITIYTGSTAEVLRSTWSSNGTQTHNTDTGAQYEWQVNAVSQMTLNATTLDVQNNDVVTSGTIALGPTPRATAGLIRVAHAPGVAVLMGRNAANDADVNLIRWHSSNTLEFGEGSSNLDQVTFSAQSQINFNLAGASHTQFLSGKVQVFVNEIQWKGGAVTGDVALYADQASGAANKTSIRGQIPGSANSRGGLLLLEGGQQTGTGAYGNVIMELGASASEIMFEITDLGSAGSRRHAALFFSSPLSTTQMPANTGDKTLFFADCATAPTSGTPVGGGILYSTGGALRWKGSGGTDTEIAPT